MKRFVRRNSLWGAYIVFLMLAVGLGGREGALDFSGSLIAGKVVVWLIYAAFLIYSIQAHRKENFFRSVAKVNQLWWGLQIGLDLYISVFLSLALIYLIEGSLVITLLWVIPVLVFANLAILPYLILNYGAATSARGLQSPLSPIGVPHNGSQAKGSFDEIDGEILAMLERPQWADCNTQELQPGNILRTAIN